MTLLEWYAVLGVAWACVLLKNTSKLMRDLSGDHKVNTDRMKSEAEKAEYEKMVKTARHRINNSGLSPQFSLIVVALSFTFITLSRGVCWIYYMPRYFILKYRKNRK